MCRSIKRLRTGSERATDQEIQEAALQFIRKVSGFRTPTARHSAAFTEAVDEVAAASQRLLDRITAELS